MCVFEDMGYVGRYILHRERLCVRRVMSSNLNLNLFYFSIREQ